MAGGRALSTRCLQGLGQGGSWLSRTPSGPSLDAFLLVFDGHPEALFQQGELADEVRDGVGEGLLWAVVRRGLHADDDLVLQGVRDFVASEEHLGVLQQLPGTRDGQGAGRVSQGPGGSGPCGFPGPLPKASSCWVGAWEQRQLLFSFSCLGPLFK